MISSSLDCRLLQENSMLPSCAGSLATPDGRLLTYLCMHLHQSKPVCIAAIKLHTIRRRKCNKSWATEQQNAALQLCKIKSLGPATC